MLIAINERFPCGAVDRRFVVWTHRPPTTADIASLGAAIDRFGFEAYQSEVAGFVSLARLAGSSLAALDILDDPAATAVVGCERSQSSRLAGTTSGRIQLTAMSGSKSPFNNYCRPGGPMMTSVGNRDGIRSRRHHASPWTANDSRPPATARHFADQLHHQSDSPCSTFELVQVGKDPPRCGSLPVYEGFCLPAYGNVWRCFEALLHRQRSHTAASARIARNTGGLTPVDAIVQAVP